MILFLSILFTIFCGLTVAQPINQFCESTANYTANSAFETNFIALLPSLATNAPLNDGFFNTTMGENPNTIYGLALCRGDVQTSQCRNCLDQAIQDIKVECPKRRAATIWYGECQLRYSDQNFFSTVVYDAGKLILVNTVNVSDPTRFPTVLSDLLSNLVNRALNDRMFAVESATFTATEDVYSLAQCTRDLAMNQCQLCLRAARADVVGSIKRGAQVIATSCRLTFDFKPFYAEPIPPPPPPPSPPPNPIPPGSTSNRSGTIIAVVVPIVVVALLISLAITSCWYMRRRKPKKTSQGMQEISGNESLQFDFETIKVATDNFSSANKLGQGGFGSVYKGTLENGQEIAVKRLAETSGQGDEEFKNEITLVAKLQHRNLVRLLGCCLEGEERILIYEYVPNASLDYFLLDPNKKVHLIWDRRFKIIVGIARGLLYLHEDSRLRIIHRDMKASNILLDIDMNPKISDFGMARLFVVDQTQVNTNRIAGTYGYMAPEYAMQGQFSVKSDVFSFGVLLLEIISGEKNTSFHQSGYATSIISHAWQLWHEGTPLELMDPTMGGSYSSDEVMRCIHIALLCVQEDAYERPTMSSVVLMLNSFSLTLRAPSPPPFTLSSKMSSMVNSRLSDSHISESNTSMSNTTQVTFHEESTSTDEHPLFST